MTEPGIDADGIAQTEADHHMNCPGCGEWFDMRDLGQVLAHVHDAKIGIERRSYVLTRSRRLI